MTAQLQRLKQAWYPVCRQIPPRRLLARKVAGQALVVFRTSDDQPHVLSALCPHRGANLAHGTLDGDCVTCPYHGWSFDGSGRCQSIPSLSHDGKLPRAKVPEFPVESAQGLLWTTVGDDPLPLAAVPAIPNDYEYYWYDAGYRGPLSWWTENIIDFSHVPFAHRFYGASPKQSAAYSLQSLPDDSGFVATTAMDMPGGVASLFTHGRLRPWQMEIKITHFFPSTTTLELSLPHGWRQHYTFFVTPLDESSVHIWLRVARNYARLPFVNVLGKLMSYWTLREDEALWASMVPGAWHQASRHANSVAADRASLAFAKRYREWIDGQPNVAEHSA